MNLSNYLIYIQEQIYGIPPNKPVQKPQVKKSEDAARGRLRLKAPRVPKAPEDPQTRRLKNKEQKLKKDKVKNQIFQQKKKDSIKSYFNYMLWTSNIIKQGEIFRKNCYNDNCSQFEVGTGDRRVCKDRCDVETCKRIIQLLKVSMSKCNKAEYPDKCKVRYMQLIPLYQNKLNEISKKFIKNEKTKNNNINVG